MANVFGDHGFPQAVLSDHDQVASFPDEVQGEGSFDHIAFYLLRPVPVEIGHGFESLDSGKSQPAFQASARTIFEFGLCKFFQQHMRGPSPRGGMSNKVIQVLRDCSQSDLVEFGIQVIARRGRLWQVHRKSPNHEG